jgi:hypothetical protein
MAIAECSKAALTTTTNTNSDSTSSTIQRNNAGSREGNLNF